MIKEIGVRGIGKGQRMCNGINERRNPEWKMLSRGYRAKYRWVRTPGSAKSLEPFEYILNAVEIKGLETSPSSTV
jgi:hypothetical protein